MRRNLKTRKNVRQRPRAEQLRTPHKITDFLGKLDRDRLRRLFLVHGSPERLDLFNTALRREGYQNIHVPEHGESVIL